jgi:hypothetical protein
MWLRRVAFQESWLVIEESEVLALEAHRLESGGFLLLIH